MTSLGEKIKNRRKAMRLTQADLAKQTGISITSIKRYESGERKPRIDPLLQIAFALRVPLAYFVELDKQILHQDTVAEVEMYLEQKQLENNPSFLSKFVASNPGFMNLLSTLDVHIEMENSGKIFLSYDGTSSECSADELSFLKDRTISYLHDMINHDFFLELPDIDNTDDDTNDDMDDD